MTKDTLASQDQFHHPSQQCPSLTIQASYRCIPLDINTISRNMSLLVPSEHLNSHVSEVLDGKKQLTAAIGMVLENVPITT